MKKYFIIIILISMLCGCQDIETSYFKIENAKISNDAISYDIAFKDIKVLKIKLDRYVNGELVNSCPLGGYSFPKRFNDSGKMIFEYTLSDSDKKIILLKWDTESKMMIGTSDTKIFSSDYDMDNLSVLTINDNMDIEESQSVELLQFVDNESFLKGINDVKACSYGYILKVMIEFD